MSSKILSAFLGGALLASGTVYLLVRPKADIGDAIVQAAPAPPQLQTAPTPPAAVDQVKPPVEGVPTEEVKPSPAAEAARNATLHAAARSGGTGETRRRADAAPNAR